MFGLALWFNINILHSTLIMLTALVSVAIIGLYVHMYEMTTAQDPGDERFQELYI